ncbi:hypothetical protein, partial [Halobacillus alkaliphilus]|uniref:hypothetical protein n=1 Tax=Halobacillus alkaliphilus TaxID=396056 RepID=UPI001C31DCED
KTRGDTLLVHIHPTHTITYNVHKGPPPFGKLQPATPFGNVTCNLPYVLLRGERQSMVHLLPKTRLCYEF